MDPENTMTSQSTAQNNSSNSVTRMHNSVEETDDMENSSFDFSLKLDSTDASFIMKIPQMQPTKGVYQKL